MYIFIFFPVGLKSLFLKRGVNSFGMNRNSDILEEGEGAGHFRSWNLCQRTEYSEIP